MKTVIFDMDGVLFDSENLDRGCWIEAAKEFKIDNAGQVFYQCIGRPEVGTHAVLRGIYGKNFDAVGFIDRTLQLFDEKVKKEGMPVKYYAKECLAGLKGAGYKLGLASSTSVSRVVPQLTKTGLIEFFDDIVGGGMFKVGKPDPEVFLLSASRLGVIPEEAYVIEDSFNGIRAAHGAGMKAIMVPDMLQPDDEIRSLCYRVCSDLKEAMGLIINE